MQIQSVNVVTIVLENEEVEIFRTILTQLTGKKIGFVKTLDLDQLNLLNEIAQQLNYINNESLRTDRR
jgi:hypothetical protein